MSDETITKTSERDNRPIEWCRSCRDDHEDEIDYRPIPADVIVWGKLFPSESMGPRCMYHYVKQNPRARVEGYAVTDLRGLTRV